MNFTYLLSNFIPVTIALVFIWRRKVPSKKTIILLVILGLVGLINAIGENPALRWGIWYYNIPKTLDVRIFGVLFETYIYCILVPIAIGSAAIKFADMYDKNGKRK